MVGSAVKFIRKNGRIIPIRAATGVAAAGTKSALRKTSQGKPPLQPNKTAKFGSSALAVLGGAAAGAATHFGIKAGAIGFLANEATDVASTGLAIGAYAGKGRAKERIKGGAELELKNQALGWSAYAGAALSSSSARTKVASASKKVLAFARKALGVVE